MYKVSKKILKKIAIYMVISCFISLLSCDSSNTNKTTKENIEDTIIQQLIKKHNAQKLDIEKKYVLEIQRTIKSNTAPFVFSASVTDLYEKNNKIYIKLDSFLGSFGFEYFILECPESIANDLINKKNEDEFLFDFKSNIFVAYLEDIKKIDFEFEGYLEEVNVNIDLETSEYKIFTGTLLDYAVIDN